MTYENGGAIDSVITSSDNDNITFEVEDPFATNDHYPIITTVVKKKTERKKVLKKIKYRNQKT